MKQAVLKIRPYNHSPIWKFVIDMRGFGKSRMFFKSRQSANVELKKQRRLLAHHGKEALGLSAVEMHAFIAARDMLAEYGETIGDAVKARVDYHKNQRRCDLTVAQFKNEYLAGKEALLAKKELSEAHIRDLKTRLNKFCSMFGDVKLTGVNFVDVEKWLLNFTNGNRRNFYAVISGMFNEAVRLEYIDKNPLAKIEKPGRSKNPPEIFTVDELTSLLETAQRVEPDILPMIAICAFSGVRSDGEISRLDYSMIDFKRGQIDLPAAVTKAGKRRVIPMQSNLITWLRPYAGRVGAVLPNGARYKRDKVCEKSGVAWRQNGLRHGFASYRLEATKDAPLVAFELGHPSPTLLYSTYREVVTSEEAARYWQIAPKVEENVVDFAVAS